MARVVVLGASNDPSRYSNRCIDLLLQKGHEVIPVHPTEGEILGIHVARTLDEIKPEPHTLTIYVNGGISDTLEEGILKLVPKRVIFNPGAENQRLSKVLNIHGIKTEEACTLVLLQTGQF
jgi:uncharacterized protein